VLVVGGGIYGLTIAYDAAQRGLSVALIDRGDFGAATSFNHLKTIHGGLRYLQSADFSACASRSASGAPLRASLRAGSRRRRSPCRPVLRSRAIRSRCVLRWHLMRWSAAIAMKVSIPHSRLPAGRIIAGAECRELFDGAIRSVPSAAVWYDYQTVSGDRLTLAFALGAAAHGAQLANYAEATSPLRTGGKLAGVPRA
jgi:glycerol-3-phosphate dehydrogenase